MSDDFSASVVIPLYNKRKTILRAIESVHLQQIDGVEIIVVDDGSTDDGPAIVEQLRDPKIYLVRQKNAGPGRARNVGARMARSGLIAFLDADDEWLPGYLEAGVRALNQFPNALAYVAGYDAGRHSDYAANRVALITTQPEILPAPTTLDIAALLSRIDALHSSSTIVRKDVFERLGGFYDAERCLWGEDSFFWAQVLFSGPIFWDPVARIKFHIEDSALGYAVTKRMEARPLSRFSRAVERVILPETLQAFRKLAKAMALKDAADLSSSGQYWKAFHLRTRHRAFNPRGFIGDVRRFGRYVVNG